MKLSVKRFSLACLFIGAFAQTANAASGSFWEEDVWRSPKRPFLYYGETQKQIESKKDPSIPLNPPAEKKALGVKEEGEAQKKLESFTTLEALQRDVKARLEAAVMDPSPEKIALYLQANAFMLEKAAAFADGWKRVLMNFPQYDHTASHPTVNAASTALSRAADAKLEEKLEGLKDDWGLVFFADASELTRHMAPLVKDFVDRWKLETVWVSQVADNPFLKALEVEPVNDSRIAARTGRGITMFPALVLVHRNDRGLKDARLVATGVASATDLMRRITLLVDETIRQTKEKMDEPKGTLAHVRLQ